MSWYMLLIFLPWYGCVFRAKVGCFVTDAIWRPTSRFSSQTRHSLYLHNYQYWAMNNILLLLQYYCRSLLYFFLLPQPVVLKLPRYEQIRDLPYLGCSLDFYKFFKGTVLPAPSFAPHRQSSPSVLLHKSSSNLAVFTVWRNKHL